MNTLIVALVNLITKGLSFQDSVGHCGCECVGNDQLSLYTSDIATDYMPDVQLSSSGLSIPSFPPYILSIRNGNMLPPLTEYACVKNRIKSLEWNLEAA